MTFALFCTVTILCLGAPSVSDDFTDRRITAGTKIFRALLAADSDVAQKKDRKSKLRLCLIYEDDWRNAQLTTKTLRNRKDTRIRKIDIHVMPVNFSDFVEAKGEWTAGIFLTQPLSDDKIALLINYAKKRHVVLFSPFAGDVERGVLGGIAVEARVRPYLNMGAVTDTGIRLKSFFSRA